jgi:hypothetical protein
MTMNETQTKEALAALRAIKGHQLGAVTFVQDYVQLAFDGPGLTAYNCPSVHIGDQVLKPVTHSYRDRLCEQITKIVSEVELTAEKIVVVFEDGSRIEVPLRVEAGCAEAAMFSNPANGYTAVWN